MTFMTRWGGCWEIVWIHGELGHVQIKMRSWKSCASNDGTLGKYLWASFI